jgi:hypothetical protein
MYNDTLCSMNKLLQQKNNKKIICYHPWVLVGVVLLVRYYTPAPPEGVYCFTSARPSVRPKIFLVAFFSGTIDGRNLTYRYAILWEALLVPSDSYFLFADLVVFYAH